LPRRYIAVIASTPAVAIFSQEDCPMADMPAGATAHSIRGEYLELPGLSLTPQQVQRLYRLDSVTCEAVLAALVDVNFLVRNPQGRYVRRDMAPGRADRARDERSGSARSRAA
jgi:hypothetical protein